MPSRRTTSSRRSWAIRSSRVASSSRRTRCRSPISISEGSALHREACNLRLDPALRLLVDLARLAPGALDRRADHDSDETRPLPQAPPRPEPTGVVRDGDDLPAGLDREQRAAYAVPARLAGRHTRALREDHDPIAFGEPLLALLNHLIHCGAAGAAVDGDCMQEADAPADDRYPGELALQHPDLAREDDVHRDRLPGGGVLPQRDVVAGRDVLAALDRVLESARPGERAQQDGRPEPGQNEAAAEGHEARYDHESGRVQECPDEQERREDDGADELHAQDAAPRREA